MISYTYYYTDYSYTVHTTDCPWYTTAVYSADTDLPYDYE